MRGDFMNSETITLSERIETSIQALAAVGEPTPGDLHPTGLSAADAYALVRSYSQSVENVQPWQWFLENTPVGDILEQGADIDRALLLMDLLERRVLEACQIISNLQSIN
jgi:hypothetical protein